MTDIGRKRTLQQFFKGSGTEMQSKPLSKAATKSNLKNKKEPLAAQDNNAAADNSAVQKPPKKGANKNALSVERQEDGGVEQFKTCAFDPSLISLYDIAQQRPQMIKQAVDSLLTKTGNSESPEQVQTLLRTCFLYFFQLVGIEASDTKSLEHLFGFLSAKNSNVGK